MVCAEKVTVSKVKIERMVKMAESKKKSKQKKPQKVEAKKQKSNNKDAFGCRLGTFRAKVNSFLMSTKAPVTLTQIIEQAKKGGASGRGPWSTYLDGLVKAGHLKKTKDGYTAADRKGD